MHAWLWLNTELQWAGLIVEFVTMYLLNVWIIVADPIISVWFIIKIPWAFTTVICVCWGIFCMCVWESVCVCENALKCNCKCKLISVKSFFFAETHKKINSSQQSGFSWKTTILTLSLFNSFIIYHGYSYIVRFIFRPNYGTFYVLHFGETF